MKRLDLVFLWHMHQPDYRDPAGGEVILPWTLLHALKDYTDMAAHLERHPALRAVVNFVPVLLDQIEDYAAQCASGCWRDPLLRWLATPDLDRLADDERERLLTCCFRCHAPTMLEPFPPYRRLHALHGACAAEDGDVRAYLSGAYLADLVVWYVLAWTGESERRREPLLAELMGKGVGFSFDDRRRLLDYIGRTLAELLPRYRALQARGQVELSATPHGHPLAPLLIDFAAAREARPRIELPSVAYPDGLARAAWHLDRARDSHAARFGAPPVGLWPAEGALSTDFVRLAGAAGCRWLASGENVLRQSLDAPPPGAAHRPWRLAGAPDTVLFFRDDRLSDLIGFEYAQWHGHDAAAHFVAELEAIAAAAPGDETPVVSVILDGENAWDRYPYNGYYFFEELYGRLTAHPAIRMRTFAEVCAVPIHAAGPADAVPPAPTFMPRLVAGSWVYGDFSTWIGAPAKNRAWTLLCAAKRRYDEVMATGVLSPAEVAAAEAQLAVCESSDWFWWFGDDNPAPAVADFDRLFRHNLAHLYTRLNCAPPAELDVPLCAGSTGAAPETGGTMRRADGGQAP